MILVSLGLFLTAFKFYYLSLKNSFSIQVLNFLFQLYYIEYFWEVNKKNLIKIKVLFLKLLMEILGIILINKVGYYGKVKEAKVLELKDYI